MKIFILAGIAGMTIAVAQAEPDLSKLPPPSKQENVTFDKDIKPVFEASCIRCHGEQRPKAGLRLDTREGVLKGTKDDKVVIPGKSAESQLVISVAGIDDETAMPPKRGAGRRGPGQGGGPGAIGTNGPAGDRAGRRGPGGFGGPGGPGGMTPPKPLTPEQVGLVRAWIDQGAK